MKIVNIGSRESKLAVVQSEMVREYINSHNEDVEARLLTMKTTGDIILDRSLDKVGGKGLFVKELDKALIEGRTCMSVHSLKDMPMVVPDNLPLIAFSRREDPRDVLVLPQGRTEIDFSLPVGCSSLRRMLQFKKLYPQAEFKNVRGNVITRLSKLDRGQYSALILAAAGIKRLGLEERISRYFDTEEMIPAAGQGILAVQGRADMEYDFLEGFNDLEGEMAALAERAFVTELNGGCTSPVAAHARIEKGTIYLKGLYYDEQDGGHLIGSRSGKADKESAAALGRELAAQLRGQYQLEKSERNT
ncbi:MAG: hydroxymethylbilane synthase [Lachnospiraceae bacterium]|nr:hydroxymethylbilane synthase [Lachnospiraceae bacterium]